MAALFPQLKTSLSGTLNMLFRLLVARSVIDLAGGDFEALPDDLRDYGCDLQFSGASPAACGWTIASALHVMRDTFESWPTCELAQAAREAVPGSDGQMPLNAYLIGVLGSAIFAKGLRASGAHKSARSVKDKVLRTLAHLGCHASDIVSPATKAGKVLHDQLARQSRPAAKRTLINKFNGATPRMAVKANRAWIPKRQVMDGLLSAPLVGHFTASRIWQIFRAHVQYPHDLNLELCLTGPGARTGLCWLFQHPPALNKYLADHDTTLFFTNLLLRLRPYVQRCDFLRPNLGDSASFRQAKAVVLQHLLTLEGLAYAACELSKFINMVLSSPLPAD